MTSANVEQAMGKRNPQKNKSRLKGLISTVVAGFRDVTLDAVPDKPRLREPKETASKNSEIPLVTKVRPSSEENTVPLESDKDQNGEKQEESDSCGTTPSSKRKNAYAEGKRKQQKYRGKPPPLNVKASRNYININNSQNVHIGHTFEQKILVSPETPAAKPVIIETKAIKALLASTDPATREHIDVVSRHVGHTWLAVGRALGYTSGQLDQFENLGHNNIKEVVYQMLLDWLQVNGSAATVGKLSKHLWTAMEREAVQKLAEHVSPSDDKEDRECDD